MKDRSVVVIADKDDAGRKHAQQVVGLLSGFAASVKVLEMPGDGVKDFCDWRLASGSRQQLIELAESTPEADPS